MTKVAWWGESVPALNLNSDKSKWDGQIAEYLSQLSQEEGHAGAFRAALSSVANSIEAAGLIKFGPKVTTLVDRLKIVSTAVMKGVGESAQNFQHLLVDAVGRFKAAKLLLVELVNQISEEKKWNKEAGLRWRAVLDSMEDGGSLLSKTLAHCCGPKSAGLVTVEIAGLFRAP